MCVNDVGGVIISLGVECTDSSECLGMGAACQKNQEDYNLNGIGDVCECYANIEDSDDEVGLFDLILLKTQYGSEGCPCEADIDGDIAVGLFDLIILKAEYGWQNCQSVP